MEKMTQIRQISKEKKSKSPDFNDELQWVPKNIEGFWVFLIFIFSIWKKIKSYKFLCANKWGRESAHGKGSKDCKNRYI
jgi:hypothetical protein